MNIAKLNKAIEVLKNNLGDSLLCTAIALEADGQSIAGFNANPKFAALIVKIIKVTNDAVKISGLPEIGKYATFDLQDDRILVVLPLGEYIWGILLDSTKTQMGLLLNMEIPLAIEAFAEAIS
ncbi:MAG TPA: hypothetical protein PLW90_08600 [Smithellaceae bacterium]|jgi:hypothetical protein|nr:hypothetical protein [Syntrophaceae bacterium]MDX9815680.1 hypothetical protein [Smithellaceae bacterium]NLH20528.1 hypothetical protein [Thermotogaceae bacterium]NMD04331.1 hypothetical protein [Deltaproteobacteria bacterium]OPZ52400.1 MAG: hypothetical protein BWY90_01143 [Deltaproteobacteria bacterium ADurb.BinA014]